jgi:cytochrome c oxidase subunit 2
MSKMNLFGIDSNDVNGKDDIIIENAQLHLPINKNIVVNLSTADVLHSFFLPNFRVKQDALPGKWIKVWFNGTKAGKYEIACAELCGSNHYAMRGEIFMYGQQDYDKWLDGKNKKMIELQQKQKAAELTLSDSTTTSQGS